MVAKMYLKKEEEATMFPMNYVFFLAKCSTDFPRF